MNSKLEKRYHLKRAVIRLEKQIDAVVQSQKHLEYSPRVDSEFSVLDSLAAELETARGELKSLDLPIVADVQFPTYMSIL